MLGRGEGGSHLGTTSPSWGEGSGIGKRGSNPFSPAINPASVMYCRSLQRPPGAIGCARKCGMESNRKWRRGGERQARVSPCHSPSAHTSSLFPSSFSHLGRIVGRRVEEGTSPVVCCVQSWTYSTPREGCPVTASAHCTQLLPALHLWLPEATLW